MPGYCLGLQQGKTSIGWSLKLEKHFMYRTNYYDSDYDSIPLINNILYVQFDPHAYKMFPLVCPELTLLSYQQLRASHGLDHVTSCILHDSS